MTLIMGVVHHARRSRREHFGGGRDRGAHSGSRCLSSRLAAVLHHGQILGHPLDGGVVLFIVSAGDMLICGRFTNRHYLRLALGQPESDPPLGRSVKC